MLHKKNGKNILNNLKESLKNKDKGNLNTELYKN